MELKSEREVAVTRVKLERLVARYEALQADTHEDRRIKRASMLSLKRLINQFKEEIARFEARHPVRR